MKKLILLFTLLVLLFPRQSFTQYFLYVSKQTGEFSKHNGNGTKTTDDYESGTVTINAEGPLKWSVNPADLSIGPNETKTWTGWVAPDPAKAPAPGSSVQATLKGNYNVTFSRPSVGGGDGNVVGGYDCGKCPAHPDGGHHDIINKIGTEQRDFTIYSIKVDVSDDIQCINGVAELTADIFPGHGGEVLWTTPSGQLNGQTVNYVLPPALMNIPVSAKFTIEGVSYQDAGTIKVAKLTGFDLPVCANKATAVAGIADLSFNGNCHPLVLFNPANVDIPAVMQFWTVNVTAASNGVVLSDNIIMVNEDKVLNVTPLQINFDLMGVVEGALNAAFGNTGPCSKSGSLIPKGSISRGTLKLCCPNDGGVIDGTKWAGNLSWEYGIKCKFPIYGCPYVASLDAVVSASANASIGVDATTQCKETKVCGNVSASANIGGGLGFTFAAGAISGDLQLVIKGIGIDGSYCFSPPPAKGEVKLTIGAGSVVGTVETLWGLTSHSVDYPLWSGYTSPPFEF